MIIGTCIGAKAVENGISALNDACSIYGHGVGATRCKAYYNGRYKYNNRCYFE